MSSLSLFYNIIYCTRQFGMQHVTLWLFSTTYNFICFVYYSFLIFRQLLVMNVICKRSKRSVLAFQLISSSKNAKAWFLDSQSHRQPYQSEGIAEIEVLLWNVQETVQRRGKFFAIGVCFPPHATTSFRYTPLWKQAKAGLLKSEVVWSRVYAVQPTWSQYCRSLSQWNILIG